MSTMSEYISEQLRLLRASEVARNQFATRVYNYMIDVKEFGATGGGVTDDSAGVLATIEAIVDNAGKGTMAFTNGNQNVYPDYASDYGGTFLINQNVTIPVEVGTYIQSGVTINIATGVTLTIEGPLETFAHLDDTFIGLGTLVYTGTDRIGGKMDLAPMATVGNVAVFDADGQVEDGGPLPSLTAVNAHIASTSNPHSVTKSQVGLSNVDNTADSAKNVLTATKLATPRNISLTGFAEGTVAFDGSQNVTMTVFSSTLAGHMSSTNNPHSTTKSQVGLGNADNTADANKNVLSATKLTTPRTISLSGDATGSVSFDGSANADIAVTVSGGGGGDMTAINAHLTATNNPHEVTKGQVGLWNVDNTADTNKNVYSASRLTTARSITLTGGATGSVSFDGSQNVSMAVSVSGGGGGGLSATFVTTPAELVSAVGNSAVKHIIIDNVTITLSAVLTIENKDGFILEGMGSGKIIGTGYRMIIKNSSKVTVKNLSFENCPIRLDGQVLNTLVSNIYSTNCTGSTGCNLHVEVANSYIYDLVVEDCDFDWAQGYASIAFMGNNNVYENVTIRNNFIHDTVNFGIEFYGDNVRTKEFLILNNKIYDIGKKRSAGVGNGAGGIYTSGANQGLGVRVIGNDIRRVLEICVEGIFQEVAYNYLEDSGCNQLTNPITDSSLIYGPFSHVHHNVLVNAGMAGGMHLVTSTSSGAKITDNVIINDYVRWAPSTAYTVGQRVVNGDASIDWSAGNGSAKWYVCTTAGTSASSGGPTGETASITDGTAVWNYAKPVATKAFDINCSTGIFDFHIERNVTINIRNNFMSGPWTNNTSFNPCITFIDNDHRVNTSIVNKGSYIGGYGNRTITNINRRDLPPSSSSGLTSTQAVSDWSSSVTYAEGDFVTYGDAIWWSKGASTNQAPPTSESAEPSNAYWGYPSLWAESKGDKGMTFMKTGNNWAEFDWVKQRHLGIRTTDATRTTGSGVPTSDTVVGLTLPAFGRYKIRIFARFTRPSGTDALTYKCGVSASNAYTFFCEPDITSNTSPANGPTVIPVIMDGVLINDSGPVIVTLSWGAGANGATLLAGSYIEAVLMGTL